jgi:uncharacterized membrane protein
MSETEFREGGLPGIHTISSADPFRWLSRGWADLWQIPAHALTYGVLLFLISGGLLLGVLFSGAAGWIMVLAGGFLFVAPMMAMGLYEAGYQLEQGQKPTLRQMLIVRTNSTLDLAYLGLALLLIYFFWTRMAQIVYGLSTYKVHRTVWEFFSFMLFDPEGHTMVLTGSVIGGIIAFLAFCLIVVSAPMLAERHTNVFVASITSFRAVARNPLPMLIWAGLIAGLTAIGIATACLGLIIVFPWIGLSTWHAYRALVERPTRSVPQP